MKRLRILLLLLVAWPLLLLAKDAVTPGQVVVLNISAPSGRRPATTCTAGWRRPATKRRRS